MTIRSRAHRALLATAAIVTGLSVGLAPAFGQFAVIDAASLKEAVVEAGQSLQQINNQITQIQQFVQMLQNEERNLTSLPLSIVQQLDQSISQITALMGQAEGLVYNVQNVQSQFQRFYPMSIRVETHNQ